MCRAISHASFSTVQVAFCSCADATAAWIHCFALLLTERRRGISGEILDSTRDALQSLNLRRRARPVRGSARQCHSPGAGEVGCGGAKRRHLNLRRRGQAPGWSGGGRTGRRGPCHRIEGAVDGGFGDIGEAEVAVAGVAPQPGEGLGQVDAGAL